MSLVAGGAGGTGDAGGAGGGGAGDAGGAGVGRMNFTNFTRIDIGSPVLIVGLKSRPELNGTRGVVRVRKSDRWGVELAGDKSIISLHPKNLEGAELLQTITSYNGGAEAIKSGDWRTLYKLGFDLANQGNYDAAMEHFRRALSLCVSELGPNHENVGGIYRYMASVFANQGNGQKSMEYSLKALPIMLRACGPEHADTGSIYANIGSSLHMQHKFEEAMKYYKKALPIFTKSFGREHPTTVGLLNLMSATRDTKKAAAIKATVDQATHVETIKSGDGRTLYQVGVDLAKQGKVDAALEHFQRALPLGISEHGPNHECVGGIYVSMAAMFSSQRKFEEAMKYYEKALPIFTKSFGREHPHTVGLLELMSAATRDIKKVAAIKATVDQATHVETIKSDDLRTLYQVGMDLAEQGKYDAALEHFQRALPLCISEHGPNHHNVGNIYVNMAAMFSSQSKHQKSMECYLKALPITLREFGPEHEQTGRIYASIGSALCMQSKFEEAMKYYKKALPIYTKSLGQEHPATENLLELMSAATEGIKKAAAITATVDQVQQAEAIKSEDWRTLYKLGLALAEQDKVKEALEHFQRAIPLCISKLGQNHGNVGNIYVSMAAMFSSQGKHQKSMEYFIKALPITLREFGPEHEQIGRIYASIGSALYAQHKFEEAMKYAKKALPIFTKSFGREHPHTVGLLKHVSAATEDIKKAAAIKAKVDQAQQAEAIKSEDWRTLNDLGLVLTKQGNHDAALEHSRRALPLCISEHGPNHPNVGGIYVSMAAMFSSQGKQQKSMEYFIKALPITLRAYGPEHEQTGSIYANIGTALDEQSKFEEAIKYYKKALPIFTKSLGREHPHTVGLLKHVSAATEDIKKAAAVKATVEQALQAGTIESGDCTTLYHCGFVLVKQGNHDAAMGCFQRALPIMLHACGPEHEDTGAIYASIGSVLYMQSKFEEAMKYYKKALPIYTKSFGREHAATEGILTCISVATEGIKKAATIKATVDQARQAGDATPKVKLGKEMDGKSSAPTAAGCGGPVKRDGGVTDTLSITMLLCSVCTTEKPLDQFSKAQQKKKKKKGTRKCADCIAEAEVATREAKSAAEAAKVLKVERAALAAAAAATAAAVAEQETAKKRAAEKALKEAEAAALRQVTEVAAKKRAAEKVRKETEAAAQRQLKEEEAAKKRAAEKVRKEAKATAQRQAEEAKEAAAKEIRAKQQRIKDEEAAKQAESDARKAEEDVLKRLEAERKAEQEAKVRKEAELAAMREAEAEHKYASATAAVATAAAATAATATATAITAPAAPAAAPPLAVIPAILELDPAALVVSSGDDALGSGSFANVLAGMYTFPPHGPTPVAVKVFHGTAGGRVKDTEAAALRELMASTRVSENVNLVQMYGAARLKDLGLCLVMERIAGKSLRDVLDDAAGVQLPMLLRTRWLFEIAQGMQAMHEHKPKPVLHRDLKASNVLLDATDVSVAHAKIADFGVAKAIDTLIFETYSRGAREWTAPETLNGVVSFPTDVYSFGILTFEVLTRDRPFSEKSGAEKDKLISKQRDSAVFEYDSDDDAYDEGEQRSNWNRKRAKTFVKRRPKMDQISKKCPEVIVTLMQQCWADDPEERPPFANVVATLTPLASSNINSGSSGGGGAKKQLAPKANIYTIYGDVFRQAAITLGEDGVGIEKASEIFKKELAESLELVFKEVISKNKMVLPAGKSPGLGTYYRTLRDAKVGGSRVFDGDTARALDKFCQQRNQVMHEGLHPNVPIIRQHAITCESVLSLLESRYPA